MARLPQPGGDAGNWGQILNDFLVQSMDGTGALKSGSVGSAQLQPNAVTNAALAPDSVNASTIADGTITEMQLNTAVQTKLNASGTIGDNSIAKIKLVPSVQASLDKAETALQAVADGSISETKLATAVQTKLNAPASIADGSVAKLKLATGVQATLDKADTALQAISDGSIVEAKLGTGVQAKINGSVNTTTDQTIDGKKTFVKQVVSNNSFYATGAAAGDGSMQVNGGQYPQIAVVDQNISVSSRWITSPNDGTMFFDYRGTSGGSFNVRNGIDSGVNVFSLGQSGEATFSNTVTAKGLRIDDGTQATGKVLTSDASGNAKWATVSGASLEGEIKMKELFQPITGILPSSEIVKDEYDHDDLNTAAFADLNGTLWNSPRFNTQAMKLVAADPQNPAFGCTNMSNGRQFGSIIDMEFEFTGDKFAIHMQTFGYYDSQIYVEHEGQMMKIKTYPLTDTHSGYTFRSVQFSRYATRRIRLLIPFVYFLQVVHENNAVIKRTPDRPMIAITGDSYVDASTSYNANSARTYTTSGVVDTIIERTGFAVVRLGQGGTGYFNNATGVASDALGPSNSSRFFSTQRLAALQSFPVGSILGLIVNGTVNDGELSGGTAGMYARALAGYRAVSAWDAGISIIPVSPEPINNPTPGNVHDLNRLGLIQAVNEHPQAVGFVDTFNPAEPLWNGTGTEASPSNDQQTKLIGMDGIHGNWAGYQLYAHYITMNMGEMKIPIARAWL